LVKNSKPNKKAITADKYNPDEWVMHTAAMYGGEDSKKLEKHLIEDVQLLPNGEMRGMLTEKLYNAKGAINMNENMTVTLLIHHSEKKKVPT